MISFLKGTEMNIDLIDGAAEAAIFTGLTRRKIYRLVELGHIPTVKKGRRLYFRRSELDRAFQALIPMRGIAEWPEHPLYPAERSPGVPQR